MALARDELFQIADLQDAAARHGIALVALTKRQALAVTDMIDFARSRVAEDDIHFPHAEAAANEILEVLQRTGLLYR